jgi:FixJ family two-component response regulator
MSKVLAIGPSDELTRRLETGRTGRQSGLNVIRRDWRTVKRRPAALSDADILLVDLTVPDAYGARGLANLQNRHPRLPLVLRTDADLSRVSALTRLLEKPTVDFVRSSADAGEVSQRIRRLLKHIHSQVDAARQTESAPITRQLVPELHHPESGRLDARRIAAFFGIPLADVARALGVSLSRLHKTPASPSAQAGLFVFERIAYALLILAGSRENARIWLNLPESQIREQTPLALIKEGRGEIVAEMLDDMLVGQPS